MAKPLTPAQLAAAVAKKEFLFFLSKTDYDLDQILDLCEEEVLEYAEQKGYLKCIDCDHQMGDPDDRDESRD